MENSENTNITVERHPLPPFLPKQAKVLILGSFPPQKHRWSMEFFYPNRMNMMWEMMGWVMQNDANFFIDTATNKFRQQAIVSYMEKAGIAIYDAAAAVKRLKNNASDLHLQVVEKTDIAGLLSVLPLCKHIACAGIKSAELVCEDFKLKVPKLGENTMLNINGENICLWRMPSTSRACAMPMIKKTAYYKHLLVEAGVDVYDKKNM